ncbi:hypothetical protein L9F63_020757, partial [Diploptera punctata]
NEQTERGHPQDNEAKRLAGGPCPKWDDYELILIHISKIQYNNIIISNKFIEMGKRRLVNKLPMYIDF